MVDSAGASSAGRVTAAVLIIGDEILSGRTQDVNLAMIAEKLGGIGIDLMEARVVPDQEAVIGAAVNALRGHYDYVFTTGGIGPTHDDITADSMARAFGVGIDYHPEALALLGAQYREGEFTEARKRMARIPDGATLIENPVSRAPGFRLDNVFVLAGIPAVAKAMMDSVLPALTGGAPLQSRTVAAFLAESAIAAKLEAVQDAYPDVKIGSYPFYRDKRFGTSLVLRSADATRLAEAVALVQEAVRSLGQEPLEVE